MLYLRLRHWRTFVAAAAVLATFGCGADDPYGRARSQLLEIAVAEDGRRVDTRRLSEWVTHENAEVRRRTAYLLGIVGEEGHSSFLRKLLVDTSASVLAEAIFAAGQLRDTTVVDLLTEYSQHSDTAIAAAAITALSKIGTVPASALLANLLNSDDEPPALRALAAESMTRLQDAASLRALIAQAANEDLLIRRSVYYALMRRPVSELQPLFQLGLSEEDEQIRRYSLRGIGRIKDTLSLPQLQNLVMRNNSWQVKYHAVMAVAEVGGKSLLPSLLNLCDTSEHPYVQLAAVNAIGALGNPDVAPQLGTFLESARGPVRGEILVSLAKLRGELLIPFIQIFAASGDPRERRAAIRACTELKENQTASLLLEHLARDPVPVVRAEAFEALFGRGDPVASEQALEEALNDEDFLPVVAASEYIAKNRLEALLPSLCARFTSDATADMKLAVLDGFLEWGDTLPEVPCIQSAVETALGDEAYFVRERARKLANRVGLMAAQVMDYPASSINSSNFDAIYRPQATRPRVIIATNRGKVTIELYTDKAPKTVANFLKLAGDGFYNGRVWHRVVPDFVIQDGCPRGDGWGSPGYEIRCEYNDLRFKRGSVGMATSGKDSGGSQFFICHSAQPHLDGRYTLFGEVVDGIDIVERTMVGDTIHSVTVLDAPEGS